MAQLSIRNNAHVAHPHSDDDTTKSATYHINPAIMPRSLTLTTTCTLEDTTNRLQTLHAGEIDSPVRTRVKTKPVNDERVDFIIYHMHGRLDHTTMHGTLAWNGEGTTITASIDNEARWLWLVALAVAALLGLLLLVQVNLPMLLMMGALPLFVIRDSFTERRGAERLMHILHQTFED